MNDGLAKSTILGALALMTSALMPFQASGQAASPKGVQPEGTPDISGTWMMVGYSTRFEENLPFQPWAAEQFRKVEAGEAPDPGAHCLPPGVPRIMKAPFPFEIFQRPGRVDMLHEYMHMVRRIYTDARPHPKDLEPTWMGHSIGRWEGDKLVVDTVGLVAKTWLDPGGDPHSDALHVIERIRRIDHGTLEDAITIDDPKAYTRIWTTKLTYELKPDWDIYEYICEENNKADKAGAGGAAK